MIVSKYNRNKSKEPHLSKYWCYGCDRNIISDMGKCEVCGSKPNKNKNKKYTFFVECLSEESS